MACTTWALPGVSLGQYMQLKRSRPGSSAVFLCLCSLTFIKVVELQGFRDCSCWEEFSQMKEQLDEMSIPSRPGGCFWYSYRHTTERRLNKHYSSVKNMTLRCSSSAAATKATTSHSSATCACSEMFLLIFSPAPHHAFFPLNVHLRMYCRGSFSR